MLKQRPENNKQKYIFVVNNENMAIAMIAQEFRAVSIDESYGLTALIQDIEGSGVSSHAYDYTIVPCLSRSENEAIIKYCKETHRNYENDGYKLFYEKEYLKEAEYVNELRQTINKYIENHAGDPGDKIITPEEIDKIMSEQTGPGCSDFLEKIQTEIYKPYKTGLDFFDSLLDGGVIRQTVMLLLAAPAAGKTTLCLQIAEALAANKRPVMYFNYEMSREIMLAKSISAKLAREFNTYVSAVQVLQGYSWKDNEPLKNKITAAVEDYKLTTEQYLRVNPDIMTAETGDLLQRLDVVGRNAAAAGREAPVVVIDYLHLLRSNKGEDAGEIIKHALEGLHEYAVKYNTFVICISAANRESNKNGRITLESGRDSSSIEYSADYQLSLNYMEIDSGRIKPTDEEKLSALQRAPERDMILRVLKNRYGIQGKYVEVKFKAAYNTFYAQSDVLTPDNPFEPESNQISLPIL